MDPDEHPDLDVIEMRLGVPKGVLTEADLPALTQALQTAAESIVQAIVEGREP